MNKAIRLAPYYLADIIENKYFLGLGSRQVEVKDRVLFVNIVKIANFFMSAFQSNEMMTASIIRERALKMMPSIEFENAIEFMDSQNFILEIDIYDKTQKYSRNQLYFSYLGSKGNQAQAKLEQSHVAIIGCGGIGNHAAFALASAGVGRITLIDGDLIEESNLTRQFLFTKESIGQPKTKVLAKAINERHPETKVNILDCFIGEGFSDWPKCDFIVVSADSQNISFIVNNYAVHNNTPFINIGYLCDIAVYGPMVVPGVTACLECEDFFELNNLNVEDEELYSEIHSNFPFTNGHFQTPSVASVNSVASGLAIDDVIKYLANIDCIDSMGKRFGYHMSKNKVEIYEVHRNPSCTCCGVEK